MFNFFHKEETVESLTKQCNKLYSNFDFSYHLAHTRSYYDFKEMMRNNFDDFKVFIKEHDSEKTQIALLKSFKEQLQFFNKNPFLANESDIQKFVTKFLPYKSKLESIVNCVKEEELNNVSSKKKISP